MVDLRKSEPAIRIVESNYENTGGNCMVLYLLVEDCGNIKSVGITEEYIIGFDTVDYYEESVEAVWASKDPRELSHIVGIQAASILMDYHFQYCLKYNCNSYIDRDKFELYKLKAKHSNETTANVIEFLEHIDESTTTMCNAIADKEDYDNKYNYLIIMNGKMCTVYNNADVYQDLRDALIGYVKENS